ncbi:MAG: LuxR C-terminal-related transcriptional regulator [Spirochaetia bacterium]|nr:LuxR C-terminal-related transcriptional regulator [Spirochaetia bacterium]
MNVNKKFYWIIRYWLPVFFLALVSIFALWDIYTDIKNNSNLKHLIPEVFFFIITSIAFIFFFRSNLEKELSIKNIKSTNQNLQKKAEYWKKKTIKQRENIRKDIENQFRNWELSKSEITVAFLIIRGYSFIQIASLLKKSERTVRQQAIEIYNKSGFNSRSEFTAFFLETIFEFEDEDSFFD